MPEKKRFLALLGSPRPQGNVAAMLKAACESAEAAGYQVERFDLYKLHIAPLYRVHGLQGRRGLCGGG